MSEQSVGVIERCVELASLLYIGDPNPRVEVAESDDQDGTYEAWAVFGDNETREDYSTRGASVREALEALLAKLVERGRRVAQAVGSVGREPGHDPVGVPFNADPLLYYESLIRLWPANTIGVFVNGVEAHRPTHESVRAVITSGPRTGAELHEAVMAIHGRRLETTYDLRFFSTHSRRVRGNSRITMPSTLDAWGVQCVGSSGTCCWARSDRVSGDWVGTEVEARDAAAKFKLDGWIATARPYEASPSLQAIVEAVPNAAR